MTTSTTILLGLAIIAALSFLIWWAFKPTKSPDEIIGQGKPISETIKENKEIYKKRYEEEKPVVTQATTNTVISNTIDFSSDTQSESTIILNALLKNSKAKVVSELVLQKDYNVTDAKAKVTKVISDRGLIWKVQGRCYSYPKG